MTPPRGKREARRWQLQAENDLAYTRVGLEAGFAAQTCFMSQQIVEKALKAAVFGRGTRTVRGHSCARLAAGLVAELPELAPLRAQLMELDQFYVSARYPNGIPSGSPFEAYSLEQSQRALQTADKVVALTRAFLDEKCPGWEESEIL